MWSLVLLTKGMLHSCVPINPINHSAEVLVMEGNGAGMINK